MAVSASDASASQFPTFTVTVNDTAPIWVYCKQANHCGQGMVFAVNSDEQTGSTHRYADFEGLAKQFTATSSSTNTTSSSTSGYGTSDAPKTVTAKLAGVLVGIVGVAFGLMM